jgi:hypothetical protein
MHPLAPSVLLTLQAHRMQVAGPSRLLRIADTNAQQANRA